ncbi:MAG: histidine phosphatase family protein [Ignavibacteriaceae bacterium]
MKSILYLLRHAKSSWRDLAIDDFDRPLNNRGLKDAPLIGQMLSKKNIIVDAVISSPAKRAIDTARIITNNLGYTKNIILDKNIYDASLSTLLSTIRNFDDNLKKIMLIGHNPGLTNLSNYLTKYFIENIPTCGVVALEFDKSWKDINPKDGNIIFFEYPKKNLG